MQVIDRGSKAASGTNEAVVSIPSGNGVIVGGSVSYDSPGAGTLKVYKPSQLTTANAAVSASTTMVIKTDAAGKVGGAVLTTSDYVVVCSSTGTVWSHRSISAVAAVSASTVSLTLGAAATCAAGDTIYIVRAADIESFVVADETKFNLLDMFAGFRGFPVVLELAATGTCFVQCAWRVER